MKIRAGGAASNKNEQQNPKEEKEVDDGVQ